MIVTKRGAILTILAFYAVLVFAGYATGAETLYTGKVDSIATTLDSNGVEYVRIISNEERKLQGVTYTIGVPVMAFGEFTNHAKTLKSGDKFKAIVQKRLYQGRESYTVVSWITE